MTEPLACGAMTDAPIVDAIDLYWRPGCGFCRALETELATTSLPIRRHNIWEDESAAAFVRSIADGNEVVPTVACGDGALVNPSLKDLLGLVAAQAPNLLPEGYEPVNPGRIAGLMRKVLGGS